MPDNKNQHFVPRCHLKPFSTDGSGKAINLYNHPSDRVILNAAVKRQCSKPYFYGEDLQIERMLQRIEGPYAEIVGRVTSAPKSVSSGDLSMLREFTYLQHSRTQASLDRRRATIEAMHELSHRGIEKIPGATIPDLNTDHKHMLLSAMRTWANTRDNINDLRGVIVRNETTVPFITSDHPAVLVNRLHQQRFEDLSFGLASSGTMFILPLTPAALFIAYDDGIYSALGRIGAWLPVNRRSDIEALNELQVLNCTANLYFSALSSSDSVKAAFRKSAELRPAKWARFWVGVPTRTSNQGDEYRRATAEEIENVGTKMIGVRPVYANPSLWFSGLRFKEKLVSYADGSAIGLVRFEQAKRIFKSRFWQIPAIRKYAKPDDSERGLHKYNASERNS